MRFELALRIELVASHRDLGDLREVEMEFATVTLDALGVPTSLGIMWFARQIGEGSGLGVRPIPRLPEPVQYNPSNDHFWIDLREGEPVKNIGAPVTVFLQHLEPVAVEIHLVADDERELGLGHD